MFVAEEARNHCVVYRALRSEGELQESVRFVGVVDVCFVDVISGMSVVGGVVWTFVVAGEDE